MSISSVGQLREICRRREFFLQDMSRKHGFSGSRHNHFSKRAAEVEFNEVNEPELLEFEEVSEVSSVCWNCRHTGHRYQECLADRSVFCYGCELCTEKCTQTENLSTILTDHVKIFSRSNFPSDTQPEETHNTEYSNKNYDTQDNTVIQSTCPTTTGPRPIIPFHVRLKNYLKVRDRIFNEEPRVARSSKRMRKFWKIVKNLKRNFSVSVLERPGDVRPYAEVRLLDRNVIGLLDTGASVTCLGAQAAIDFLGSQIPYKKLNTTVNTADGKPQRIAGVFTTEVVFRNKSEPITIYVVPNLSQDLILGIDFWRKYNLLPQSLLNGISSLSFSVGDAQNLDQKYLSVDQKFQLQCAIDLFPSFAKEGLGKTNVICHTINTGGATPIKQRHFPVSPAIEKLIYEELDRMLAMGVIEESTSPWSSPIVLHRKPGKNRLCLDSRKLNAVTEGDAYPLPHIDGILSRLPKAEFISSLDLKDAFWQIPLDESSKVMPFGLCNAPQTMCRLMDRVIPASLRAEVLVYLDDLLVVSPTFDRHLEVLKEVAKCLRNAGLTINTNRKFVWTEEAQKSFEDLKSILSSAPVLHSPDFSQPFFIHCDASKTGIGGVLVQKNAEGDEFPVAFMSKKLNQAQRNYSVTEQECLAAMLCIKKFRAYVEGHEFTVITDHASLKWLMSQTDLSTRLARWALKLQGYRFKIEHRKGSQNIVPDALSRTNTDDLSEICGLSEIRNERGVFVDLKSEHFSSDDYKDLLRRVDDNIDSTPDLKIIDGYLYRRTEHAVGEQRADDMIWKLWIPKSMVPEVLQKHHDDPLSSHCGINKTLERIRRYYFWPNLVWDVKNYVNSCEFTADAVIKYMEEDLFHTFGVPESVISDNGTQFKAKKFNDLLNFYKISHIYTAVHSPQANASERVNRSVISAIKAYVKPDQKNWDEKLSHIARALRSTVHTAIGTSPYFMVFGQNMVTNGSIYQLLRKLNALEDRAIQFNRSDTFDVVRSKAANVMRVQHDRNERQYNLRSREVSYNVGQEVYRRNFSQSSFEKGYNAKLAPTFIKCRVRRRIGTCYYELEDLQGKLVGTYHAKDMRQ
ncbi:uncharacterized protein LOC131996977 [Stomoxys calcitrans]|uniref:uncharacterized protein LOC131996977 n=1 Tax=Stomoxys calcitrans TaxID=35570 RepID=UPI0027E312A0|nr:uncharacterized protein LOC131996977 [Stomoxys calcitrans]